MLHSMIIRNKGSDDCGVEMIVMLIVTATAATTAVDAAVDAIFLVLPSLYIVDLDRDRVRDDIDLAVALDFSDLSFLLIRFDSIRFDLI